MTSKEDAADILPLVVESADEDASFRIYRDDEGIHISVNVLEYVSALEDDGFYLDIEKNATLTDEQLEKLMKIVTGQPTRAEELANLFTRNRAWPTSRRGEE